MLNRLTCHRVRISRDSPQKCSLKQAFTHAGSLQPGVGRSWVNTGDYLLQSRLSCSMYFGDGEINHGDGGISLDDVLVGDVVLGPNQSVLLT